MQFIIVTKKHWRLFVATAVVSAVAAFAIAKRFASETYDASTTLVYNGLPPTSVYDPPEIGTLAQLIETPGNLSELSSFYGMSVPHNQWKNLIQTKVMPRTQLIELRVKWNDPHRAIEALNHLSNRFIEQVAATRKKIVEERQRHAERSLLASKTKIDEIRDRLNVLKAQNAQSEFDLLAAEREAQSMVSRIESTRGRLEDAQLAAQSLKTQIELVRQQRGEVDSRQLLVVDRRIKQLVDELSVQVDSTPAGSKSRARIESRLEAIRDFQQASNLTEKIRELYRFEEDYYRGQNTFDVNDYRSELDKIDQRLVSLDSRASSLELSLIAKSNEINLLNQSLTTREAELENHDRSFVRPNQLIMELETEYEAAEAARKRIEKNVDDLRQLERCQVNEFAVAVPPFVFGEQSNAKKLGVGSFFGLATLFAGPVLLFELLRKKRAQDAQLDSLGVPILESGAIVTEHSGGQVPAPNRDALRLLALRIQQSLPRPGSIVLISPLDTGPAPHSLVYQLAKCFSEREERVLIVDTGKCTQSDSSLLQLTKSLDADEADERPNAVVESSMSGQDIPGLSDFICREDVSFADVSHPIGASGIDMVGYGVTSMPDEALATRRMGDLLDRCRKDYTLTLVCGPSTGQMADLQMSAARADAVLFANTSGKQPSAYHVDAIRELVELQAPVIGVVG